MRTSPTAARPSRGWRIWPIMTASTDLPNRAAFLQALAQMIEACAGTDEEFAVLCVDLDGLKEINDGASAMRPATRC